MTPQALKALDKLAAQIDQLRAEDAADVDPRIERALALAWWYAEAAIRGQTGNCSMGRDCTLQCGTCHEFQRLTTSARTARL